MARKKKVAETAVVPVTPAELVATDKLVEEFVYEGETGHFVVYSVAGEPLVRTDEYSLAIAKNPSDQVGFVMIASSVKRNEYIDAQRRILTTLQKVSSDIDAESVDYPPTYGVMFPVPLDSFTAEDGRTGIFLGYHASITSYKQLVPLVVVTKDVRVDLQTGAWMLGKLLKLLDFVHLLGFSIGIDASNIFIEKDMHGVFVLDFSNANENPTDVDKEDDIRSVATAIWEACGGRGEERPPLNPENEDAEVRMHRLLRRLGAMGEPVEMLAGEAMTHSYEEFDQIWPKVAISDGGGMKRQWHDFVTYPR